MKIKDIIDFLNEKFPIILQEKYDNAGEQIAYLKNDITNILIAVDIDKNVLDEALEKKCNLILTHHPFIFKPLKKIITGEPSSDFLLRIMKNELSIYAAHTNLDKIFFNKLGNIFEIENEKLLIKTDTINDKEYGFGIFGELKSSMTLREFLSLIKNRLNLEFLIYSGMDNTSIKKIAAVNGAGGSVIEKILSEYSIDCIITGDISYHHCKTAINYGIPVIDAGHFGTERILLNSLKDEIEDYITKFDSNKSIGIYISQNEINPFKLFV